MVEIFIRASGCVQGETAVGLLPALGVALTTGAEVRGTSKVPFAEVLEISRVGM
jgi:hypothetical protein